MVAALVFIASACIAIYFIYQAQIPLWWRAILIVAVVLFAVLAYVLATKTDISPFSTSGRISFGAANQWPSIIIAVIGAVAGVIGSYFFHLGSKSINWRSFIPPLATAPLVLIPTIKLVEASGEQTALGLLLLFALSYQNGFFWERLLKPATQ